MVNLNFTILSTIILKIKAIDWPFGENGKNGGRQPSAPRMNISDYLAQRKIDLVINLPLRQHR